MRYPLSQMAIRAKKTRRKEVVLRPIIPPSTLASDLYSAAYAQIIAAWTAAIPAIIAEYETSLSAITTDSPSSLARLISSVESTVDGLRIPIRLRLESWAARVERWQRGKWVAAIKAAVGVDVAGLVSARDMSAATEAAVERNVSLVRSVSEEARGRITQAVMGGLSKRSSAADVAKEIRGAVAMGRRRSLNIASDQLVKIGAQLNSDRRREAGLDAWEWMSSHKVNYRPEHLARDGKRYSDDEPPSDLPGELPYCGCGERAVLSLDPDGF